MYRNDQGLRARPAAIHTVSRQSEADTGYSFALRHEHLEISRGRFRVPLLFVEVHKIKTNFRAQVLHCLPVAHENVVH